MLHLYKPVSFFVISWGANSQPLELRHLLQQEEVGVPIGSFQITEDLVGGLHLGAGDLGSACQAGLLEGVQVLGLGISSGVRKFKIFLVEGVVVSAGLVAGECGGLHVRGLEGVGGPVDAGPGLDLR